MKKKTGKTTERLGRLDKDEKLRSQLLQYCRLKPGEIWEDPVNGHRVGVVDCISKDAVASCLKDDKAELIINDPPYNVVVGNINTSRIFKVNTQEYMEFTEKWVQNAIEAMDEDAHLYVWLGADVKDGFQPLPEFMLLMRDQKELKPRNYITLRNQRGYGTQKNWMWVRQELLHYVKGNPDFKVVYTDIPRVLKGYYKKVDGKITDNLQRSKSDNIRPGNVWIDIQQVFYRMEENVPGCYAQKPLAAIERIMETSSRAGGMVVDFFSHSGTTLIAGERLGRRVVTIDIDPVFAELTIRRLERYREEGKTGWQWHNPFPEVDE